MNFKNFLVAFFVYLSFSSVMAQKTDYEVLGNSILVSVVNNDIALFKSLIIPEEVVWENLKKVYGDRWSKEEEEQALKKLSNDYKNTVEKDFLVKFNMMVSKVELFDLKFKDVSYEVLREYDRYDKQMGIQRIFGTINHPKFKYFSFGMIRHNDKFYLVDPRVDISEVNKYSERIFLNSVVMSENDNGGLQSRGRCSISSNKSDSEVFQCLIDNLTLYGVTQTFISPNESSPSYLKGTWQFPYRITEADTYIGLISFNFEYTLFEGELTYKFDSYKHFKDGSDFESLGIMPFKYNKQVSKVFEQNDYYEILYDTQLNVKSAIKQLKQAADKCLTN